MGGVWDTSVLIKRIDYNPEQFTRLVGYSVEPVATFFRVKDGNIEEFLDRRSFHNDAGPPVHPA